MQTKYLKDITISRYLFANLVTIFFSLQSEVHISRIPLMHRRMLSYY